MATNSKQKQLTKSLYRNLLKWCRSTPSDRSLSPLNLTNKMKGTKLRPVSSTEPRIQTSKELRRVIQAKFREDTTSPKESTQIALEGLRLLYSIDVEALPTIVATTENNTDKQTSKSPKLSTKVSGVHKKWVETVEWLPSLDETKDQPYTSSDLPLFPLSSATIPNGDDSSNPLPLFSPPAELPVNGMEIPLNIFEPRYQEMYRDVLADGRRHFVVPMSHPYHEGRYAKYAWLYEIVRVQDIADQTRGQIQLVAHHLVTRPVLLEAILNPEDWKSKSTYLRVRGKILEEVYAEIDDLGRIGETLRAVRRTQKEHVDLADRLLASLAEGTVWPLVSAWMNWLQLEALNLQIKIAAEIQIQGGKDETEKVDDATIRSVQYPFRMELESLLCEISTLIPLLMQESAQEQCDRMIDRIQSRLLDHTSMQPGEGKTGEEGKSVD